MEFINPQEIQTYQLKYRPSEVYDIPEKMSTAFGVHMGNSSACIAVSKEGKTDVVANDAGDR